MKKLNNLKGQELIIRPNYQDNTFEIEKNGCNCRTIQLTDEEFESCLTYTGEDWQTFLNGSDNYYFI
jgi:hypothetical protein